MEYKRTYNCFVCGKPFPEYEQFRTHIIQEHEEGRHYILCPLIRCQSPVRCLRSHFKFCHKYDKVPQLLCMRAIEWFDPRQEKKVKKVPIFKEGFFTSKKNGGKKMHYRSNYELTVYKLLEKRVDVEEYEVEPIGVEYNLNGSHRRYYPDLKVKFTDGRIALWEVKPANQKGWQINEAKWGAARNYCANRGWSFEVITEAEIKNMKNG
jgi:TnsA-like endonuclease N terminal